MSELFGGRPWRKGKQPETLIAVKKQTIADLFGVSIHTINKWQQDRKIDLRDLRSICDYYAYRGCMRGIEEDSGK